MVPEWKQPLLFSNKKNKKQKNDASFVWVRQTYIVLQRLTTGAAAKKNKKDKV